jgi:hypothetical protein
MPLLIPNKSLVACHSSVQKTGILLTHNKAPTKGFVRIHQTLKAMPAMAAQVTTKLWEKLIW